MSETKEQHIKRKQIKNLDRLVRNNAFQFTDTFFPYTSGQIGPYYVQSAAILKNGVDYRKACEDMAIQVKECEVISGGETRDWMFSFPTATIHATPHAMLYKNGKILGANMKDKIVAHVADLNNEGSSPRDYWVPMIKKAGGEIKDIYFYVDRLEDGVEEMKKLGLNSHALVPLNEVAWEHLRKERIIKKSVYNSLMERMENKDEWARNMLRSKEGLRTLSRSYHSHQKEIRDKAIKIIEVGYPDIKDKLLEKII